MKVPDWIPDDLRRSATIRRLDAGETLFRREDRPLGLYVVESGEIRLSRTDTGGRETILFRARPGDTLAEASLFSQRYHCDAVASRPTSVHLFSKNAVLAALAEKPATAAAFMAALARQVMALRTRLENRAFRTARERVLHHLAVHESGADRAVPIVGSLKELASELGLTHESLYRTLASLEAEGAIRRSKGAIRLLVTSI